MPRAREAEDTDALAGQLARLADRIDRMRDER
jgi:ubiquinone biosynthesis protein UbiJ